MFQRHRPNIPSIPGLMWSYRSTILIVATLVCLGLGTTHSRNASAAFTLSAGHWQEVRSLAAGEPIEGELAGGEAQIYRIAVGSGEYISLLIEPRGIELKLKLSQPDGNPVAQVDSFAEGVAGRRLSFIPAREGDYQLSVFAVGKTTARGNYRITIAERRSAASQDVKRVAAERAVEDAERLDNLRKAETTRQAIAKFEEALGLWREAGDRRGEADTLESLSVIWRRLSEYQKSLDSASQSLQIRRDTGDRNGEASALTETGQTYIEMSEYQKALDYYNQALTLNTGIRQLEAQLLNNIGAVYRRSGDYRRAVDNFSRSLALIRATGDRRGEAFVLNNLGVASQWLGEYQRSLDCFGQALKLWRALSDTEGEGLTTHNLGAIYSVLGDFQQAINAYKEAAQLRRAAGNRAGEAIALDSLGGVYRQVGDREKALETLNQALTIYRAINDRRGEETALDNLGAVYRKDGDYQRALDYFSQSVQIARTLGDRHGEANSLYNTTQTWYLMGDFDRAKDYGEQVLQLRRETGNRIGEPQALLALARAERKLGNLTEALAYTEAGIEIIERLRIRVASSDLRAAYQARNQDYYEFHIDLLMQLQDKHPSEGHAATALQVSERARSRSLLDLLTDTQADLRQDVDAALLDQERMLMAQINSKEAQRRQLLSRKRDEARIAAVDRELNDLLARYREVQARIRADSPRYAALTQPQPLSLKEIQQRVIDDESLLLEYKLGTDRSYLWAVTPHTFRSFALPARAEIEKASRRLNELLFSSPNQSSNGETPRQRSRRLARSAAGYQLAAAELSQILLGQVKDLIGKKRLLIVSDGALQYIPFGALPAPEKGRHGDAASRRGSSAARVGSVPLIVNHEIVNLPSASVLAVLRQEKKRAQAHTSVAVVADPVFSVNDERLGSQGGAGRTNAEMTAAPVATYGSLQRSAREAGIDSFYRLRFSREEARAITGLLPAGRVLSALDFKASRATATSPELGRYGIVHFATHGLLNTEHAELSGLVLSLVDERGQPQDGFLRLHEVYSLKLSADLVVLSGCETALGKEIRGEGLIGLTRGFMYAGAPRVVASLWQVDDRATAELMRRFYQGMLKQGLRPAAALRAAQVSMLREQRWAAPHYWAAFIIQGEFR